MKNLKYILAVMMLVGCGKSEPSFEFADFSAKVKRGMSKDQVLAAVGKPWFKAGPMGMHNDSLWSYHSVKGDEEIEVWFTDEIVSAVKLKSDED